MLKPESYFNHESTKFRKHENKIISCFYGFVFSWLYRLWIVFHVSLTKGGADVNRP